MKPGYYKMKPLTILFLFLNFLGFGQSDWTFNPIDVECLSWTVKNKAPKDTVRLRWSFYSSSSTDTLIKFDLLKAEHRKRISWRIIDKKKRSVSKQSLDSKTGDTTRNTKTYYDDKTTNIVSTGTTYYLRKTWYKDINGKDSILVNERLTTGKTRTTNLQENGKNNLSIETDSLDYKVYRGKDKLIISINGFTKRGQLATKYSGIPRKYKNYKKILKSKKITPSIQSWLNERGFVVKTIKYKNGKPVQTTYFQYRYKYDHKKNMEIMNHMIENNIVGVLPHKN